jgi:hypothetical protein
MHMGYKFKSQIVDEDFSYLYIIPRLKLNEIKVAAYLFLLLMRANSNLTSLENINSIRITPKYGQ